MRTLALLALLAISLAAAEVPVATASPWPLDVTRPGGVVTVYQPQPERLVGTKLTARAAVSWLPNGADEKERIFAAVWMEAILDIDRANDVAKARSLKITKVLLPNGEIQAAGKDEGARKAVEDAIVALGLETDLDRLAATIEEVDGGSGDLSAEAPAILVRTTPALLIPLAGKPLWKPVAGGAERLMSTPAFIVKSSDRIWLRTEGDWLVSADLAGPWAFPTESTPEPVKAAATAEGVSTGTARASGALPAEIILADKASELLLIDGEPEFIKLTPDGTLEVCDNTEDDIVREAASGRIFVLCSGRWFAAAGLADGQTWTLTAGDALPASFASIPATGERAHLRAHVAGTEEAIEAAALAQVPQTAMVPLTNTIDVAFEGDPKWIEIAGRNVAWAENSADAVFRIPGPAYYCCRDAVWYVADAVTGPWKVATSKPEALDNLPASCPWSNTNAVTIYEHTTEYVYTGCTSGYYGWYVYGGCPVYGSGYWYGGYYGGYYHYPATYGVRVRYNPYTGNWAVGVGVAGPGYAVGGIRVGGSWGSGAVVVGGGGGAVVRPGGRPVPYSRVQGAKSPQLAATGDKLRGGAGAAAAVGAGVAAGAVIANHRNNNYAVDSNGQVLRNNGNGALQERADRDWKDRPATAKERQPAVDRPIPADHPKPADRPKPAATSKPAPIKRTQPQQTQQMRSRGETRVQQRASPPPRPASRPAGGGGGARGGGGGARR
jgi:hypothetical protein